MVFFLVSGYVITHVLQTEQSLEFLVKRIFRIFPLYIFAVLFQYSFIYFNNHAAVNLKTLILQLLLVGDFFQTPYSRVDSSCRNLILLFYVPHAPF